MSDATAPDQPADPSPDEGFEQKQSLLDRFRGTGVGVEDPNIVGNVGPTDVAPGQDPDPNLPPGLHPSGNDAPDLPLGRDPETEPPGT